MSRGGEGDRRRPIRALPDALGRTSEIRDRLAGRPAAVFLDFDGTLAPIAGEPEEARLPPATREALRGLADRCPVAVLSGRDLEEVVERVGLGTVHYAGSHGFDLRGPGGFRERLGEEHRPALAAAETALRESAGELPGVRVERKRYAVAVHHRRTPEERVPTVESRVEGVARRHPGLEVGGGKQVLELRPASDWDKGRALLRLLDRMVADGGAACPIHVGDDVTDEDAFRAVAGREGVAVVVRGEDDGRPTRAEYALEGPGAVRRFLSVLTEVLAGRTG